MKKLVIIRHAKSDWGDPYLDDHSRPLAERGLRDAPKMAQRLKKRGIYPDEMLSSDAERAKATALITAENLKFAKEDIRFTPALYHASAHSIFAEIKKAKDPVNILFVFGHNPGLNGLISLLGGKIDNLPTSGQFGFTFDTDSWKDVSAKNAEVWFFDYPKAK
jgi:phosphohistidine phosphatase